MCVDNQNCKFAYGHILCINDSASCAQKCVDRPEPSLLDHLKGFDIHCGSLKTCNW